MEHSDIQSIIFCDFFTFFLLPQVKQWAIITYKHGIYELPQELSNDYRFRISRNWKMPGQCLKSIEWYPRTQSPCQNENFFNTSKKLLKNRNLTSPVARYFTWTLELGSDILWMTVDKQMKGSWFSFQFVGSLSIKYDKVNDLEGLSYIKSWQEMLSICFCTYAAKIIKRNQK